MTYFYGFDEITGYFPCSHNSCLNMGFHSLSNQFYPNSTELFYPKAALILSREHNDTMHAALKLMIVQSREYFQLILHNADIFILDPLLPQNCELIKINISLPSHSICQTCALLLISLVNSGKVHFNFFFFNDANGYFIGWKRPTF